jgi:hypothetical protein
MPTCVSRKPTKATNGTAARPDAPLKDDVVSVRVEANSEETVELFGIRPAMRGLTTVARVSSSASKPNSKKTAKKLARYEESQSRAETAGLVHGLWSNWQAWSSWQNILTTSHSYDWKAFPVGENRNTAR